MVTTATETEAVVEIFDAVLSESTLERALAVGDEAYHRNAFNNLKPWQLRSILYSAEVSWPGDLGLAKMAARYIIEAEFWDRQKNGSRAAKVHQQLRNFMALRGIKFLKDIDTDENPVEEEGNDMGVVKIIADKTTEVQVEKTNGRKPSKFAKKGSAPAKKEAAKAPAKKATAPSKKEAPAKTPAAKKAPSETSERNRYSDDEVFAFVRGLKEEERIPGSNKRGSAILDFIKEKKRVRQADIIAQIPKLTKTSQEPSKVWAFYRPLLLNAGLVKVAS